eukprot:SAG11_NODE_3766_length_2240_cov_2.968239_3_plen_101_part_01
MPRTPTVPRRSCPVAGGGYAARFRFVDTSDGFFPGGDGFARGPDVTGSAVFDPAGNRSMLVYDGLPGNTIDQMQDWLDDVRRAAPTVSAETNAKLVFLNGA